MIWTLWLVSHAHLLGAPARKGRINRCQTLRGQIQVLTPEHHPFIAEKV
jgi:hypothetical protein